MPRQAQPEVPPVASLDQLQDLRNALKSKPPFRSGVVSVFPEDLILYYGKGKEARYVSYSTSRL